MLNRISPLILLITLTSCGGGGGDGDAPANADLFPADFNLFKATGTWRLTGDVKSKLEVPTTLDSLTVTGDINLSGVSTIKVNGDDITLSDCNAMAPETIQSSELESVIENELSEEGLTCVNENIEYTKLSDSNYTIRYTCDDLFDTTIEYIKLDNTGDYNFGNLMFTYDISGDLNATTGVCGTINNEHLVTVITPQPNSFGLENTDETYQTFTVVAPYNGERIEIDFRFTRNITVDSYIVALDAELSNDVEVNIELMSTQFLDVAETGTVNITAISQFSVSGDFTFVTTDGNNMSGNFSFDIE